MCLQTDMNSKFIVTKEGTTNRETAQRSFNFCEKMKGNRNYPQPFIFHLQIKGTI